VNVSTIRSLVGRPVRVGALDIGIVDDVVLGADLAIVLGVVVETKAARHCFLPWVALHTRTDGAVEAVTTATVLGEVELEYYLRSGTRLSRVLGLMLDDPQNGGGGVIGDVAIAPGGRVEGFVVSTGRRKRSVALADTRVRWSEGQLLELSVGGAAEPARPDLRAPRAARRRVAASAT
jgi:hypothetical protein